MDASEFRANIELVAEAHKLLSSALFRSILNVLETEAPHRKPVNSTSEIGLIVSNETLSSVQLGRIAGYEDFRKKLLSLGEPLPKENTYQPEATYTQTPDEEQPNA